MVATVIDALRRFLPAWLRGNPRPGEAQWRTIWAINQGRTAEMSERLHARDCGTREFRRYSPLPDHESLGRGRGADHSKIWFGKPLWRIMERKGC